MFRERTILVVDDEPDILELASAHLKEAGYRSLSAANADIAFIILNQPAIAFDLLITDIIMPGTLDGVSLVVEAPPSAQPSGHLYDRVRRHRRGSIS